MKLEQKEEKWPFLAGIGKEREKRERGERGSTFSLGSMELGWSSCFGPRLKVGVLIEGNAWTPKQGVFVGDSSGKFGRPWVLSFPIFEKLRLLSKM